jgi:riboflavin kinase/FMN adenylyltransferase
MTNNAKYVATIGMFDGVHRGHQALIAGVKAYAAEHSLQPMVFTFTPHPMAVVSPGREPKLLTPYDERHRLLTQSIGADAVVELQFDENLRRLTAEQFMCLLRDKYGVVALIMGYNHNFGSDRLRNFADYKAIGDSLGLAVLQEKQLVDAEAQTQVSSSSIRNALAYGNIALANKLLGRCYDLQGDVVTGRQLGRTIGFPTANIRPDKNRMVPAPGVYAAETEIDGVKHAAMINIGVCPTVANNAAQSIEVNVIDWSGNLYSSSLTVRFVSRLRSEKKFDSLDALQQQLEADRRAVLAQVGV